MADPDRGIANPRSEENACQLFVPLEADESQCEACGHLFEAHDGATTPKKLYKDLFGFDEVRPYHEQAVNLALGGKSIFLVLPTGNGKSYCFWAPVISSKGLAIIVEPLLALISDQLARLNEQYLNKRGHEAVAITGMGEKSPGKHDIKEEDLFTRLRNPKSQREIKFIYMTAEKLSHWIASKKLDKLMRTTKVSRIIFDEAFVLKQWRDFRPAHYDVLETITKKYTDLPYTLATACMTPSEIDTLKKDLNLAPTVIIGDLSRPNLFINVRHKTQEKNYKNEAPKKTSPLGSVIALIKKYKDDFGIIYCISPYQIEELYTKLIEAGVKNIDKYYGVRHSKEKTRSAEDNSTTMDKWHRGQVKCIIATTAFGMGIDKPNVRYVVHWKLPESAVSYYQQIGRAGRDGLPSECLMYYAYTDVLTNQKAKKHRGNDLELRNMMQYCRNYHLCRHVQLSMLLGQKRLEPCGTMCDVCVRPGGVPPLKYHDYSTFAKDISFFVWRATQSKTKLTLRNLSILLRKKEKKKEEILTDELIAEVDQLRRSYRNLKHYNHELLIELVLRGHIRGGPSTEEDTFASFITLEKEPDGDKIWEFLVPEPLPTVLIEMHRPEKKKKQRKDLKRKREFMDSFLDEDRKLVKRKVRKIESSESEERSTGNNEVEWVVKKFLDRNMDYAQPYLEVEWETGEVTWEPEQVVRQNCAKLYADFRQKNINEGKWVYEPDTFDKDFYAYSASPGAI